jgi:DNA polymerase epsilon subunit 4
MASDDMFVNSDETLVPENESNDNMDDAVPSIDELDNQEDQSNDKDQSSQIDSIEEEVEEDDLNVIEEEDAVGVLSDKTNTDTTPSEDKADKLFRFPQGTVKRIMKLDPDVHMVNADAIFLVSKATEQFIESLAQEAQHFTSNNKKKTISKADVHTAIESTDCLAFLDGAMED